MQVELAELQNAADHGIGFVDVLPNGFQHLLGFQLISLLHRFLQTLSRHSNPGQRAAHLVGDVGRQFLPSQHHPLHGLGHGVEGYGKPPDLVYFRDVRTCREVASGDTKGRFLETVQRPRDAQTQWHGKDGYQDADDCQSRGKSRMRESVPDPLGNNMKQQRARICRYGNGHLRIPLHSLSEHDGDGDSLVLPGLSRLGCRRRNFFPEGCGDRPAVRGCDPYFGMGAGGQVADGAPERVGWSGSTGHVCSDSGLDEIAVHRGALPHGPDEILTMAAADHRDEEGKNQRFGDDEGENPVQKDFEVEAAAAYHASTSNMYPEPQMVLMQRFPPDSSSVLTRNLLICTSMLLSNGPKSFPLA